MDIGDSNGHLENGAKGGRKGRRAKKAEEDLDVVDNDETPSKLTKSATSVSISNENVQVSENTTKQGWAIESTEKSSTSRRAKVGHKSSDTDFFDTKTKKTVVGGDNPVDDGIVDMIDEIPDMMDMAVEQADIAAAPAMRSANVVKTVEELENEMNQSSYTINQMQLANIQGLDLSLLISNAMVPIEHLEEEDSKWEWDVVFNQIMLNNPQESAK